MQIITGFLAIIFLLSVIAVVVIVATVTLLVLMEEILITISSSVGAGIFVIVLIAITIVVLKLKYLSKLANFEAEAQDINLEGIKAEVEKKEKVNFNLQRKRSKKKLEHKEVAKRISDNMDIISCELYDIYNEIDKLKLDNNELKESICPLNDKIKSDIESVEHKYKRLIADESDKHSDILNRDKFLILKPHQILNVGSSALKNDFTGVYIIRNKASNKYYVGQSLSVMRRMRSHFSGHGNKDIYTDYTDDESMWETASVSLADSGFDSLNELERHYIKLTNANITGYNKTKGNRN